MIKNQSATIPFFVYNPSDGSPVTGATSISVYVSLDGDAPALATNSAAEVDASHSPGIYKIVLTATEMNADVIVLSFAHASYAAMPVTITPETIDVPGSLNTYGAAKTSDVTAQTSTLMEILQEVLAGLFNWGLSHDVLTIYKDGAATKTFQITRDSAGNITAISPIDESSSGEAE